MTRTPNRIEVIHPAGEPSSTHPPIYRCSCGQVHNSPHAAFECRHRLRPIPITPEPGHTQLTLEVTDAR